MKRGTYVGDDPRLQGKTALVITNPLRIDTGKPSIVTEEGSVLIQANDVSTGLGHGWHEFPAEDWEVEAL